jgi:hypothetical protein
MVSFTDIDGVAHDGTTNPMVQVGDPSIYTSGWSQALGASAYGCADQRNPQIQIPIPRLNLDEKLADGSGHRLFDVLEPSDVDRDPSSDPTLAVNPLTTEPARAIVYAQISIQPSLPLASGGTAAMCINGVLNTASGNTAAATVKSDDLAPVASATVLHDNSVSSHGYYAAIDPVTDPSTAKNTLTKWLSANTFNPNVPGWGADAHAVYTNNFDLGFGRDMYMKVGNCDAGVKAASPATLLSLLAQAQQSPNSVPAAVGQCDIAAVVVNYVSVQAAANRLNPINAVAMEYSAVAGQGARFVKFYAFAPDTRTGVFQRVSSVDLDHRGQKSMPQSCVVCHGGTPGTAVTNSSGVPTGYTVNGVAGGNLNAGFISWDLDSFLYSDTDPGFSQKAQDADLKATYTRAKQEPQLKLLNFGAYLTMGDANRFALARELVTGWYGGASLPFASFNNGSATSKFVPDGWKPANNGNPANSDVFYEDVFARTCRMCHIQQAPKAGVDLSTACAVGDAALVKVLGASSDQFPMGCYFEFVNTPKIAQVLSSGKMPFARRTADRLWIDAAGNAVPGATTRGEELIGQLNALYASQSSTTKIVKPGTPSLQIGQFPTVGSGGSGADVLSFVPLNAVSLPLDDGFPQAALLLPQPTWQVCVDVNSGSCSGSANVVSVVGSNEVPAAFQIPHSGNYLAELDSAGSLVTVASLSVPAVAPVIHDLTGIVKRHNSIALDGPSVVTPGNGPLSAHFWWLSDVSNLVVTTGANCTSSASQCSVATSPFVLSESDGTASSASYTINVVDADGSPVVTAIQPVTINSSLSAAAPPGGFVSASSIGTTVSNNTGAVDFTAGNTPSPGDHLVVQIACTPDNWVSSCSVGGGVASVVGHTLIYTPRAGFATEARNGTAETAPIQISYRLQEFDGANAMQDVSAAATYGIHVRARVAWLADVYNGVLNFSGTYPSTNGKCTDCHTGGGLIDFTANSPRTTHNVYCDLVGCPPPSVITPTTDNTLPFVNTAVGSGISPLDNSVLLRHPGLLDTEAFHSGGQRCPPPSPTFGQLPLAAPYNAFTAIPGPRVAARDPTTCDLTNILTWIEDGANEF